LREINEGGRKLVYKIESRAACNIDVGMLVVVPVTSATKPTVMIPTDTIREIVIVEIQEEEEKEVKEKK
jgi:hypothetical protein